MSKIVTLGEMLVDFTPYEIEGVDRLYQQNAGGAPANVAVQAAVLGAHTTFIGKVGSDDFGRFLANNLEKKGVSIEGLVTDHVNATSFAFVTLNELGERSFNFVRSPGADTQLKYEEIRLRLIDECDIFHFGSISLATEPSKTATMGAVEYAKEKRKIVTYDPNYRSSLWTSVDDAIKAMKSVLYFVDVIKVSENELNLISGCEKLLQGIATLLKTGIKVVIVTQGAKGCIVACHTGIERLATYDVDTIDTTGSGDCFFGAFLYKLGESGIPLNELTLADLIGFCDFANACGSLCATKKGAITPWLDEIEDCMKNKSKLK